MSQLYLRLVVLKIEKKKKVKVQSCNSALPNLILKFLLAQSKFFKNSLNKGRVYHSFFMSHFKRNFLYFTNTIWGVWLKNKSLKYCGRCTKEGVASSFIEILKVKLK